MQNQYLDKIADQQNTIEKGLRLATAGEVFASITHDIMTRFIPLKRKLL